MLNKRTKSGLIISILTILTIGLLIYFYTIERRTLELNQGPDAKVNQQPYLAAKTLLNQLQGDGKVETQQGFALLSQLPSTDDVIIIDGARKSLTWQKNEDLVKWIEAGGHLIVRAIPLDNYYDDSVDLLLARYGITTKEIPDLEDNDSLKHLQSLQDSLESETSDKTQDDSWRDMTVEQQLIAKSDSLYFKCVEYDSILSFKFKGEDLKISRDESQYFNLEKDPTTYSLNFAYGDGEYYNLLQLAAGKGRLTLVDNMWMWRNKQIACDDHGYLLHLLTQDAQKVWWLYNEELPGLMTLLWHNAPWLILGFVLLLFTWIWSQTLRFGPIYQLNRTSRRSYLEHLSAAAKYRFFCDESEQLIDMLRQQILQKLTLKHRELNTLSQTQQCELISRLCDLNQTQIFAAMFDTIPTKPEQTVKLVQKLQQLRKQLC